MFKKDNCFRFSIYLKFPKIILEVKTKQLISPETASQLSLTQLNTFWDLEIE